MSQNQFEMSYFRRRCTNVKSVSASVASTPSNGTNATWNM